jgi:UDP-3-O-[3-hydroxymyristoyl] glucosamine N-acyltransferase
MYRLKKIDIYASEIAEYLSLKLIGHDVLIKFPCSVDNIMPNSITFIDCKEKFASISLANCKENLFIVPLGMDYSLTNNGFLVSLKPKIDFIKVLNEYFTEPDNFHIAVSAKISPDAIIARNVSIGENVVIGPEVTIGENTEIRNNVIIDGPVKIGGNCIIKDNASIGSTGYHFEVDEKGHPLQCPNLGKIIIGDNVWIGTGTAIESASFDNTIIGDSVKIDDLVQIGYSSIIGEKTMVTAGVIVSRYVKIAESCTIGPNSTIGENVNIESNSIIGMGSVVLSDIEKNAVYVGNPARFLKINN